MTKKQTNVVINDNPLCGRPVMVKRSCDVERPEVSRMTQFAEPLGRTLVGQQVDGVNLNPGSLLSRQYDDEFGKVDPASDIHTDPHLLQDALMRDYRSGLTNKQNPHDTIDAE